MSLFLTPIQLLLTAVLLLIAAASLRAFRNRLLYRLLFLAVLLTGILFILVPDIPVRLAQVLNVGRGVDVVFYLLFTGVLFALLLLYRRLLNQDETITAIIRQAALRHARKPNDSVAS